MDQSAQSLASVLKQYLQERGLEHAVVESSIPDVWRTLIGAQAARHCTRIKLENKMLHVHIDSSVWRSELRLRKEELQQKLNEELKADLVHDIQFH